MAISGRFEADFSSFQTAVQAAEVTLRSFEQNSNKVETQLSRMTNSFSGTKVIQDAALMTEAVERIGGASKLTEAEQAKVNRTVTEALAKYQALGQEAPASMIALADATRSTHEPTQTLSTRIVALGAAVGSFVGNFAAQALQAGIRSLVSMGEEAFESAGKILDLSNKTGLSADAIQRMQFVADQTGGTLEDFTGAAFKLGVALAGGSTSVQKAVGDLGISFQDLKRQSPEEQFATIVDALGNVDDATERNRLGVALFGKSFATIAASVKEGYVDIANGARASSEAQLKALDAASDRWSAFTTNLKSGITSALGNLILQFDKLKEQGDLYAIGLDGYASRTKTLAGNIELVAEKTVAAAPVVASYTSQLATAKAEVAALSAEQLKELEAAQKLGVGTDELTAKFGLSEAALKLVTEAQKDAKKAGDEYVESVKKWGGIWDEMARVGRDAAKKLYDAQLKAATEGMERQQKIMIDKWRETAADVEAIDNELSEHSQAGLQKIADKAKATYEKAAEYAGIMSDSSIEHFKKLAEEAQKRANEFGTAFVDNAARAAAAIAGLTIIGTAPTFNPNATVGSLPSSLAQRGVVEFRAAGGPVSAGSPYMVGEQGPELFVPGANGSILPNGGGVTVYNTFQIVDTESNIARRVSEYLTRSILSGRKVSA